MSENKDKCLTCPLEKTLSVIGNKWTFLIIRDLLKGTKRFGELSKSLEGISPRTLSQRMKELEAHKVVEKKVYPVIPLKVEYSLTKKGKDLALILDTMGEWSDKYM